ncbi:MAG: alpha-galactosidase [Flavobacteriales bacterium]|nr:alpha-galactosidase [Flavobacteriales bacterium]MDW8431945.1 alpha-galactosidase [Flavobacteriales bacterium]
MFPDIFYKPFLWAQIFEPEFLWVEYRRMDLGAPTSTLIPFGKSFQNPSISILFSRDASTYSYFISFSDSVQLLQAEIQGRFRNMPDFLLLSHGFQSWSESRYLGPGDKQKPPSACIRPFSRYYGDTEFFNYKQWRSWQHSWNFTAVPLAQDTVELLASLNENEAYTCIRWNWKAGCFVMARDVKGKCVGSEPWPLFEVYHQIGPWERVWKQWALLYEGSKPYRPADTLRGWTSWYYHYNKIDENRLLENVRAFCEEPVQVIQIDDGYQKSVGEWTLTNEKFPRGVRPIADSVHRCGKKAGIWVAPFVVSRRSQVFREHPDWLLKTPEGKPLRVGYNPLWGGWYYALDFYRPEVQDYLGAALDTLLRAWNFDFLKADFLFAVGVLPRPNKNRTRAGVMSDALEWLRKKTEGKDLLLCGVPLGPAFKKTDYCRIGNDVHLRWDMGLLQLLRAPERPSTRLSIQNTLTRAPLGGLVFQNDPDVFILREERQHLSKEQKELLFRVNTWLGAILFTSDNPSRYSAELRKQWQSYYKTPEKPAATPRPLGGNKWLLKSEQKDEVWVLDLKKGRMYSIGSNSRP